ncbi:probable peptide chain release factor C12orf65 homolog, mitochondrial [Bradysia coprophila]|uniref:probable peptide chain release factor C12orf65 homolog, mitochondrial n=1 Tax=Bradysia coprophila TaxID=38358 RepID=UPI00187D96EE|nr:probable peptide chain release factor C12orf65 homolog, mitochondrial [Bradysia coprophila]
MMQRSLSFLRLSSTHTINSLRLFVSKSTTIDFSRVPKLNDEDLEEQFVRGSGPGGQAVNKTANCVILKHKPTGIQIKCHTTRMLHQNRQEARRLLIARLDNLWNGDDSVEAQEKRIFEKKHTEANRRRRKLDDMKKRWMEREKLDET